MAIAQSCPGLGNPLLLTMHELAGIVTALADSSNGDAAEGGDHRAYVERQMRQ